MFLHPHEPTTTSPLANQNDQVEVARLVNKTHLLIQTLGGLLPGLSARHLQQITTVLEIACGPGVWTQEMAKAHPQIQITGVERNQSMLAFARSMLHQQELTNLDYLEIPTFVDPYPFHAASFDLVSVQFLSKFLTAADWPRFLAECWRLVRPGGLLRVTEFEVGLANAPAHEELSRLFIHAMRLAGRSFSPSDRHLGLLCALEPLLYAAHFQECVRIAHAVNYSYGAPLHEEWKRDFLILSREIQPLIVQMGLATQEQVDTLHQQQRDEMNRPTFCAILPLLTVWGTKR